MEELKMIRITDGDLLHVYGSQGMGGDYSVRLEVQMKDVVDGETLQKAVENTSKRYPYLSLQMKKNETELYYEENPAPVVLLNTDRQITLAAEETNFHVWAVCFKDDRIFLDIYHGIADGTGMYMVFSTLLYYYCEGRYGIQDHMGIRTLEDEIRPEESADPVNLFPEMDPSKIPAPSLPEAFSIINDGGARSDGKAYINDVKIPEAEFVRFCQEYEASPGTMLSLLMTRAIHSIHPQTERPFNSSYVYNGRPMLGAPETHHNCVGTNVFQFADKMKKMPFDLQATAYRGMTFMQSDADRVKQSMAVTAARSRMVLKMAPTVEAKCGAFAQMLMGGIRYFTYMVSYVGKWKYASVEPYILEFWTHVPKANPFLTELAAVNGILFLSIQQGFEGNDYLNAFFDQLKEHGIPYELTRTKENDTAHFPKM